jgi:1,4-alpha-glucan branching enzyme
MSTQKFQQIKERVEKTPTLDTELLKRNDYLGKHQYYFDQVKNKTLAFIGEAERNNGGLLEFAHGYKYYGFNFDEASERVWFREWLPGAKEVYLFGEFNCWHDHEFPLKKNDFGVWEISWKRSEFPLKEDQKYRLRILNAQGKWDVRNPAYCNYMGQDPKTYIFDALYVEKRRYEWQHPVPKLTEKLRIYECHIGMSTEKKGISTFEDFRTQVLPRIQKGGYNAIQLMAIAEHAYYGSFGYHVTGYYAPSSRYGKPDEFRRLIDECHERGILVLLDIVHSHFSKNSQEGLAELDGTDYLYSHGGEKGFHKQWDSKVFNYSKYEVVRYLLSNLVWWIEEFNVDGFRFDGITSMLYTHHGRLTRHQSRLHGEHGRIF